MAAANVYGVGNGSSNKFTTTELAKLVNGPTIHLSGFAQTGIVSMPSSPPIGNLIEVIFPKPLAESSNNYIVILQPINVQYAYLTELRDHNDKFSGFSCVLSGDGTIFYLVIDKGLRPKI